MESSGLPSETEFDPQPPKFDSPSVETPRLGRNVHTVDEGVQQRDTLRVIQPQQAPLGAQQQGAQVARQPHFATEEEEVLRDLRNRVRARQDREPLARLADAGQDGSLDRGEQSRDEPTLLNGNAIRLHQDEGDSSRTGPLPVHILEVPRSGLCLPIMQQLPLYPNSGGREWGLEFSESDSDSGLDAEGDDEFGAFANPASFVSGHAAHDKPVELAKPASSDDAAVKPVVQPSVDAAVKPALFPGPGEPDQPAAKPRPTNFRWNVPPEYSEAGITFDPNYPGSYGTTEIQHDDKMGDFSRNPHDGAYEFEWGWIQTDGKVYAFTDNNARPVLDRHELQRRGVIPLLSHLAVSKIASDASAGDERVGGGAGGCNGKSVSQPVGPGGHAMESGPSDKRRVPVPLHADPLQAKQGPVGTDNYPDNSSSDECVPVSPPCARDFARAAIKPILGQRGKQASRKPHQENEDPAIQREADRQRRANAATARSNLKRTKNKGGKRSKAFARAQEGGVPTLDLRSERKSQRAPRVGDRESYAKQHNHVCRQPVCSLGYPATGNSNAPGAHPPPPPQGQNHRGRTNGRIVRVRLDEQQQHYINERFPQFAVEYRNDRTHSHPVAHTMRQLSVDTLLEKIAFKVLTRALGQAARDLVAHPPTVWLVGLKPSHVREDYDIRLHYNFHRLAPKDHARYAGLRPDHFCTHDIHDCNCSVPDAIIFYDRIYHFDEADLIALFARFSNFNGSKDAQGLEIYSCHQIHDDPRGSIYKVGELDSEFTYRRYIKTDEAGDSHCRVQVVETGSRHNDYDHRAADFLRAGAFTLSGPQSNRLTREYHQQYGRQLVVPAKSHLVWSTLLSWPQHEMISFSWHKGKCDIPDIKRDRWRDSDYYGNLSFGLNTLKPTGPEVACIKGSYSIGSQIIVNTGFSNGIIVGKDLVGDVSKWCQGKQFDSSLVKDCFSQARTFQRSYNKPVEEQAEELSVAVTLGMIHAAKMSSQVQPMLAQCEDEMRKTTHNPIPQFHERLPEGTWFRTFAEAMVRGLEVAERSTRDLRHVLFETLKGPLTWVFGKGMRSALLGWAALFVFGRAGGFKFGTLNWDDIVDAAMWVWRNCLKAYNKIIEKSKSTGNGIKSFFGFTTEGKAENPERTQFLHKAKKTVAEQFARFWEWIKHLFPSQKFEEFWCWLRGRPYTPGFDLTGDMAQQVAAASAEKQARARAKAKLKQEREELDAALKRSKEEQRSPTVSPTTLAEQKRLEAEKLIREAETLETQEGKGKEKYNFGHLRRENSEVEITKHGFGMLRVREHSYGMLNFNPTGFKIFDVLSNTSKSGNRRTDISPKQFQVIEDAVLSDVELINIDVSAVCGPRSDNLTHTFEPNPTGLHSIVSGKIAVGETYCAGERPRPKLRKDAKLYLPHPLPDKCTQVPIWNVAISFDDVWMHQDMFCMHNELASIDGRVLKLVPLDEPGWWTAHEEAYVELFALEPFSADCFAEFAARFPTLKRERLVYGLDNTSTICNFRTNARKTLHVKVEIGYQTDGKELIDHDPRAIQAATGEATAIMGPFVWKEARCMMEHTEQGQKGLFGRVFFCTGMKANVLDDKMNFIRTDLRGRLVYFTLDGKRQDCHICGGAHSAYRCSARRNGASDDVVKQMEESQRLKGKTATGIKYATNNGLGSGDIITSTNNSKTEGFVINTAIKILNGIDPTDPRAKLPTVLKVPVWALNNSDDSVVVCLYKDAKAVGQALVETHKRAGIEIEIVATEELCKVEFCSGRWWSADNNYGFAFGPKFAKLLPKLFTMRDPRQLGPMDKHVRGVCLGMRKSVAHLPIARVYIEHLLQLAERTTTKKPDGLTGRILSKMDHMATLREHAVKMSDRIYDDYHLIYGLSRQEIAEVEMKILAIQQLPAQIHWGPMAACNAIDKAGAPPSGEPIDKHCFGLLPNPFTLIANGHPILGLTMAATSPWISMGGVIGASLINAFFIRRIGIDLTAYLVAPVVEEVMRVLTDSMGIYSIYSIFLEGLHAFIDGAPMWTRIIPTIMHVVNALLTAWLGPFALLLTVPIHALANVASGFVVTRLNDYFYMKRSVKIMEAQHGRHFCVTHNEFDHCVGPNTIFQNDNRDKHQVTQDRTTHDYIFGTLNFRSIIKGVRTVLHWAWNTKRNPIRSGTSNMATIITGPTRVAKPRAPRARRGRKPARTQTKIEVVEKVRRTRTRRPRNSRAQSRSIKPGRFVAERTTKLTKRSRTAVERNPYLASILAPEAYQGVRIPDGYSQRTAVVPMLVDTPVPYFPEGDSKEVPGSFNVIVKPDPIHPVWTYGKVTNANGNSTVGYCDEQASYGLRPLNDDDLLTADQVGNMILPTGQKLNLKFPCKVPGQDWPQEPYKSTASDGTIFYGSVVNGLSNAVSANMKGTININGADVAAGDNMTIEIVDSKGTTPVTTNIVATANQSRFEIPNMLLDTFCTLGTDPDVGRDTGRPGVGVRITWAAASGIACEVLNFQIRFYGTAAIARRCQYPIDMPAKELEMFLANVDKQRPVSCSALCSFVGNAIEYGGQIASVSYQGGEHPQDIDLWRYTGVVNNNSRPFKGILKTGTYVVWKPRDVGDFEMQDVRNTSGWDRPYICIAGIVQETNNTTNLTLRVWVNYEVITTSRFLSAGYGYANPAMIREAMYALREFPLAGENETHLQSIRRFLGGAWEGAKQVITWANDNKGWLVPAGMAVASLL